MSTPGHFRSQARRSLSLPAKIAARGSDLPLEARLVDVGLEGAALELTAPVEAGDALKLLVELPGLWDPLAVESVVAWTLPASNGQKARAGVRFEAPNGRTLRLLAELIAKS